MTTYKEIEDILGVFSLEEVLAQNDLTPEDALLFLVDEGFLELPDVRPI